MILGSLARGGGVRHLVNLEGCLASLGFALSKGHFSCG